MTAAATSPHLQQRMPAPAPRRLGGRSSAPAGSRATPRAVRLALAALTAGMAGGLIWAMAAALAPMGWAGGLALGLFAVSVGWTSLAAGVALLGLLPQPRHPGPPPGWRPRSRTAVLILTCGEPTGPVLRHLRSLHRALSEAGLTPGPDGPLGLFVLSDTRGPAAGPEARALASLADLPGVWWRQRPCNTGRKPGNLADWLARWSGAWDHMIVLDADSRMSAGRIAALIHRLDSAPEVGLVQAGIRLLPARSRFGALQRLSGRLAGPGFGRGMAAWTGAEGNYWGHNAAIRIEAFAAAARLPRLSGRAPWGGDLLSHDFVEAALLRRAGWAVEIAPDSRGSFEDVPQRLDAFHRRDRRWCQGNLQHLRLLAAPGLHPASRVHLACGVLSYLAAPVWLGLILSLLLAAPGDGPAGAALLPLAGGLALLAVPKLAGALRWMAGARGRPARARVVRRAVAAELALSTALAPLMLLRQSLAVAAVLAGRDCGWRPAGGLAARAQAYPGRVEAAAGLALAAAVAGLAGPMALAVLAPVLTPLLAAPWLVAWLEGPWRRAPRRRARLPQPALPARAAA